jgi:hypothetical protein
MDIPLVLFGLANLAIVVYAFDRLGAMIPDSSWGGLYVVVERMWSWTAAVRSSEGVPAQLHNTGSDPTDNPPPAGPPDEPVAVIEELSGTPSRWLW